MKFDDQTELRDKFALTAPGVDPLDICDLMGWEKSLPIGDPSESDGEPSDQWRDSVFARWREIPLATRLARWREIPLATRLAVMAKYSYAYADAMIKERDSKK